ncbi:phosphopantetheine-binding protein [Arcicella sp. LKC2W]|uniref:phosphopantetheine-binding protein n=1 Tax=Arcicella sp. LKC2W TaxID=2984198 RepID=UPI002B1FBE22|nr:phosphopantetheine-binding protein [Arcicella sp. LKC2W]MEA5460848.1 phosphopantetheine-binding protein [Arcicella sp. LKC2W]
MEKSALIDVLKIQIIQQLNLDIDPKTITEDSFLFGDEGLGLDSIDALELVVLLDKNYNIKVGNPEDVKEHFKSLSTLADYVLENSSVVA